MSPNATSLWLLNLSRKGNSTTALDSLFKCLVTFYSGKCSFFKQGSGNSGLSPSPQDLHRPCFPSAMQTIPELLRSSSGNRPETGPGLLNQVSTGSTLPAPQPGGLFQVTQGLVVDFPHRKILPHFAQPQAALGSVYSQHWGLQWLILPALCILLAAVSWGLLHPGKTTGSWEKGVLWVTGGSYRQQKGSHRWQGGSQAAKHLQTCWSVVMHPPSWDTCPWRINPALCLCRHTDLCLIETSPKKHVGRRKPSPSHSPGDSHMAKGQHPVFQL